MAAAEGAITEAEAAAATAAPEKVSKEDEKALKTSMINEAKAMNNMEGKDKKGDVRVVGQKAALEAITTMVSDAAAKEGKAEMWELKAVHLGKTICAGKKAADVYVSFLLWAQKDADREADSFNVSKAFRRLEAFAVYGNKHFAKYFDTPVDAAEAGLSNIQQNICPVVIPKQLYDGCVLWVIDLEGFKLPEGKPADKALMRYMWGLMLVSLFDQTVCSQGAIIWENFLGLGFFQMMKFQGMFKAVEKDINTMFYGTMPFKMKSIVLTGSPWWMNMLLGLMRLFISRKMSKRIVNTTKAKAIAKLGGADNLPVAAPSGTQVYEQRYDFLKTCDAGGPLDPSAKAAAAGGAAEPPTPPAAE